MSFKMKLLPLAVAQVVAGGALTVLTIAPAMAQQVTTDTQTIQRVEVTGSNIRRADAETPSPLQVISGDDMKKSGFTTVSEVLRSIASNGQGTLSNSNSEAFAGGGSGIALRGLTVGATLVLIDGHRMAPYPLSDDGERQFVDITSIPFDAVDHIEILKDGASAVYGSDAIAGVVNVILKKKFEGTTVSAEGGNSQQGGGAMSHLTFSHGFGDLDADGYNGFFNLEYRHSSQILADQRSDQLFTNSNWSFIPGGNNLTAGVPSNFNGGFPATQTPYLYNQNGPAGPGGTASSNPANYAFYGNGCNYASMTAGNCGYANTVQQIQPQTSNLNLLGSFTKKLAGDWELNLKASYFDSKGQQDLANNAVGIPLQGLPGFQFGGNTAISPTAPPTPSIGSSVITVPANYPGNPFGVAVPAFGLIQGVGGQLENLESKNYRLVADFSGTLGAWDTTASVGYTKIATTIQYSGLINYTALNAALNAPAGSPGFYNIAGGNSQAVLNSINPTFNSPNDTDELDFVELHASRSLMSLPGGDFSIGTGGEFIHKSLNAPLATQITSGEVGGVFQQYNSGQQNDAAAYFEFYAPVLKTLELDGAVRLDHYDTFGNSTNPKLGFKWTPTDIIGFRGTASTGFRAPNSSEVGNSSNFFGLSNVISDPVLCPGGNSKAVGVYPAQCQVAPGYVQTTTNQNLQPEKSKSLTFGAILEPVKGWSTTVDYYNIQINNQIVTLAELPGYPGPFQRGTPVEQTYNSPSGPIQQTPAVGNIVFGLTPYVNANTTKTSGLEIESHYKWKMGDLGSLTTTLDYTHVMEYVLVAAGQTYYLQGTHGPNGISGDTGNPRDRAQLTLSYDRGPLDVTTTFNWVSDYSVIDPSAGNAYTCQQALDNGTYRFTTPTVPTNYCEVKAFLDTDLTVRYNVNKQWVVHAGVQNLFNQAPPIDLQTYGSGYLAYNPAIAQAGAIGRYFTLGASYHF